MHKYKPQTLVFCHRTAPTSFFGGHASTSPLGALSQDYGTGIAWYRGHIAPVFFYSNTSTRERKLFTLRILYPQNVFPPQLSIALPSHTCSPLAVDGTTPWCSLTMANP